MELDKLAELIRQNKYNPENIFYHSLDHLESNGIKTVTGTMPMISLLEHQVAATVVNNDEIDLINRYLNPNYCDTHESLARHLDYNELPQIHAIPGQVPVTLAILVDDLNNTGYKLPNGARRVVIPEDTIIGFKDEIFYGIHHAIQITMMDNETIDVNYIDNSNPLHELDNPVIESQFRRATDVAGGYPGDILELNITAFQFKRTYHNYPVNASLGFNKSYDLTDQYYHARVFTRSGNDWIELKTCFSEFIYNSFDSVATTVIKLEGTKLTVNIPQVYFSRGLIGSEVKVVIYTTKGNVEADYRLSTIPDWSLEFKNTNPKYQLLTEPLASFRTVYAYSRGKLAGGTNIPDIDSLRTKVIVGDTDSVPITEARLRNRLAGLGYKLVHELNYISDNLYVASKRVEDIELTNSKVMVEAGGLDVMLQKLGKVHGVLSNGNNYTLTPDIVAKLSNGVVTLLTPAEVEALEALGKDDRLELYNGGEYLATPFYYLVEQLPYNRKVTVFDMDSPQVVSRDFIGTNPNNSGLISTRDFELVKEGSNFKLKLTAITNDTFLNYEDASFIPQLTVKDSNGAMFSINGTITGRGEDGEYLYEFDLTTNYDLSYLNTLVLNSVTAGGMAYTCKLDEVFKLTYNLVKELPVALDETFKEHTEPSKLPNSYQTITYEELHLRFGLKLDSVYTPTETFTGAVEFQKHQEDVLAYYEEDVYEEDSGGFIVFSPNPDYPTNPDADPVTYNKLHSAGEQVFEADGVTPVYKYKAGTLILDAQGKPIPVSRDNHIIKTKLLLINYKYSLVDTRYQMIKDDILYNLVDDIAPLEKLMLGLTELKYNLSNSLGKVRVRYDSQTAVLIDSALSFELTVTVDGVTYRDGKVRGLITSNIQSVISDYVNTDHFAMNVLTAKLNAQIEDTVEGFSIDKVNGKSDIVNFKLTSPSDVIGLKSEIFVDVDNTFKLQPAIKVNFKLAEE